MKSMKWLVAAAALTLFAVPAQAQKAQPAGVQQQGAPAGGTKTVYVQNMKDPGIATIASILLTGAGQMYTGEVKRGLAFLGGSVGSVVAGVVLTAASCSTDEYYVETCSAAPMALGWLGSLAFWGYGVYDAHLSAERANAKLGAGMARVAPVVAPAGRGNASRYGLSVAY